HDGRLVTGAREAEIEGPPGETEQSFGSEIGRENVKEVRVGRLVENWIIAIGGREPLARRGARDILFAIVVEEVGGIQGCLVGEDIGALANKIVVVINFEDRSEIFGLQAQILFHL